MVFSSHLFLFTFLPVALLLYYAAPLRARHLVLTLLSYLFYGWANPLFVVLMLTSTVVDFLCGLYIARSAPGDRQDRGLPQSSPAATDGGDGGAGRARGDGGVGGAGRCRPWKGRGRGGVVSARR